jgi:hypothetical protein
MASLEEVGGGEARNRHEIIHERLVQKAVRFVTTS